MKKRGTTHVHVYYFKQDHCCSIVVLIKKNNIKKMDSTIYFFILFATVMNLCCHRRSSSPSSSSSSCYLPPHQNNPQIQESVACIERSLHLKNQSAAVFFSLWMSSDHSLSSHHRPVPRPPPWLKSRRTLSRLTARER